MSRITRELTIKRNISKIRRSNRSEKYVKVAQQRIEEVAGCKAEGDNGIPPMNKLMGILPNEL